MAARRVRGSRAIARLLRPLSVVYPGEGLVAVLMLACVFFIMTAYYLMKTAREGLILTAGAFGLGGGELKAYASGAMALLLVAVVPLYGALADRVRRIWLINAVYALVLACLVGFFALARAGAPIGLTYFVWLGIVSILLTAQFWSYANDIYDEEQGKRLFAVIGVGAALGAIVGPQLAKLATTHATLLVATGVALAAVALFNVIEHTVARRASGPAAPTPLAGKGGFALVLQDRYLLLIAGLVVVANLINTVGEYILSSAVTSHAAAVVPPTAHAELAGATRDAAIAAERRELIKDFYGDFFFWVNLVGFTIQAFLVSRIIRGLGVRGALFVVPLIAFGAYGAIAAVGGLAVTRASKVMENGTDYSLQNTVRHTLFLPTDRAAKYKAKAATDTFFVRAGDTLSAGFVAIGIHQLGFGNRQFAIANLVLSGLWIALAAGIARRHRALRRHAWPPARPRRGAR